MSLFQTEKLACPGCGKPVEFHVNYSVNADRRPDFRDAILDGSFQREECGSCGKAFRLEPEMTYIDVKRGQWILVRPASRRAEWQQLEADAASTFELAYGAPASPQARAIGKSLAARVTFGWAALREKLVCGEAGLDDATLELLKISLVRGLDDVPLADDTELRLVRAESAELVLAWIRFVDEVAVEPLRVPRSLYDEIAAAKDAWKPLREQLTAGPYVDVTRLLVASGPAV